MAESVDLVVRGATVLDGTGAPGRRADVAVTDGVIVGITGSDAGHPGDPGNAGAGFVGELEIDGQDRVVAPGFIDAHAHDDQAVLDSPQMTAKLSQGVTTVVAGNCGISLAPLTRRDALPAPFPLIGDDEVFRYSTVALYRDAVTAAGPAINIALLAGHTSLRATVLEDLSRPATAEKRGELRALLATALDDGCIGMSSGLDYPPGAPADEAEMACLTSLVGETPGAVYTSHVRDESDHVVDAVREALGAARAGAAPLVLSHHKCAGPANYGRSVETLRVVDEARVHQEVGLDVYPYTASSTSLLDDFARSAESVLVSWSEPQPEQAGRLLEDIVADWGCSRTEAIDRLSPAGAIYFQIDEGDLRRILAHPAAMVGSDGLPGRGRPHPRLWGTFPRVLARYVRDQKLLSLPAAVHKMTGLTAATFGLHGRGEIAVGNVADLVVFDPARIADTATFDDPERAATGIDSVIVGGRVAWSAGAPTGTRPGRFLARRDR